MSIPPMEETCPKLLRKLPELLLSDELRGVVLVGVFLPAALLATAAVVTVEEPTLGF